MKWLMTIVLVSATSLIFCSNEATSVSVAPAEGQNDSDFVSNHAVGLDEIGCAVEEVEE